MQQLRQVVRRGEAALRDAAVEQRGAPLHVHRGAPSKCVLASSISLGDFGTIPKMAFKLTKSRLRAVFDEKVDTIEAGE